MSKSRFRLIALATFIPEDIDFGNLSKVRSMQKKTFGKGWMYFGKGYRLEDAPGYYNDENGLKPFRGYKLSVDERPDFDRALYDKDDLCVSVNAIVGANGSGKSSTVDMILRVLNNFSVAAMGETKNTPASEHLYYIDDVYGCLVFKEGGYFYQIVVDGRSVRIGRYERCGTESYYICSEPTELLSEESRTNKFDPIEKSGLALMQLGNMFYTAIFNYSLYAFNYNDYFEERTLEDRWHNKKKEETNQGRYWNGEFSQNRVWLNGLFHKNDGYQTPIVLNPMREEGQINVIRENNLAVERILSKLLYENPNIKGHDNQPAFPFRYINEHLEIVALKLTPIKNPKFSRQNVLNTLRYKDTTKVFQHFDVIRSDLTEIWSSLMQMPYSEETDEEKLAWDYVVYKTMKISKTYSHYNKITRIAVYNDTYDKKVLREELRKMLRDESHVTTKLRRALYFLKYNIYKKSNGGLVNLFDVYRVYKYWIDLYNSMDMHIKEGHLYMNAPDGWSEKDLFSVSEDVTTGDLYINTPDLKDKPLPLIYLEDGRLTIKSPDEEEMILPPIYDIKMMVIEKEKIKDDGTFDNDDLIPLDGLSSGEKQLIYSVSNYVYHLVNINSVGENKNKIVFNYRNDENQSVVKYGLIKYKYINLILDEVELYFHPDLQRRYLKSLMDMLGNINLNNIDGVSILIITHSPFILSDIPGDNIMYLDNHETCNSANTFGGNIHEMLGESFFMESNIGAYAEQKISEFIALYYDNNKNERRDCFMQNIDSFKCLKEIVADAYLKGELEDMYLEMCDQYRLKP